MPRSCAAAFCKNNAENVKKRGLNITFHSFPSDDSLPKWIDFCKRDEHWKPTKISTVCSLHFKPDDYQMAKSSLPQTLPVLKRLKPYAIPSLIQPADFIQNEPSNMTAPLKECNQPNVEFQTDSEYFSDVENVPSQTIIDMKRELDQVKEDNRKLIEVNTNLRDKLHSYFNENKRLKAEIDNLQKHISKKDAGIDEAALVTAMKERLKPTLSENQIDIILKKKKRVVWTKEEIGSALTLKYFGLRCYKYLAKDRKFPLPADATLKRYTKNLVVKEGILDDVLKLISNLTSTFTEKDRLCALSFDEMKVNRIIELDKASDEIIGPHNYLQVVMARGLCNKWKQPVYIGFDKKMTKEILLKIIEKLSEININVVAIISDNCSTNVSCWKELGAKDYERPYFQHPTTLNNVYVIPDAPHLLKLLRNWFLDSGFTYNGKHIKADLLFDMIASRNETEITPLYKLSKTHLVMTPQERQNVRRAAQLLSHTTAISLRRYFKNNAEATDLANFIEKVDLWFSISNSYSPFAKLDYKKSYTASDDQIKALDEMFEIVSNMTVIGKHSLQIFQKSLLMQITSLKLLYDDLHKRHNISFISTHKVINDIKNIIYSY
uniref:THAP-type domain-containing protein n=1 Tax=Anopheles gambiae TaxID=7165 RepID=A0A453YZ31_ANOGA